MRSLVVINGAGDASPPWWQQPAVDASLIAFFGVMITLLINHGLARSRNKFEDGLVERKFDYDRSLIAQKRQTDQDMEDWRRRSEFAEQSLAMFYEAASRIAGIRSQAGYATENAGRPDRDREPDDVRAREDNYFPLVSRIQKNARFFATMQARRFRAMALLGDGAETPFVMVDDVMVKINRAARILQQGSAVAEVTSGRDTLEEIVWAGLADSDKIADAIDEAVAAAAAIFTPIIKAGPSSASPTTA